MKGKYIIVESFLGTQEVYFTFPLSIGHDDFARSLRDRGYNVKVISAGFWHVEKNNIKCYGHSVSLNVSSRKEDSFILNKDLLENANIELML